MSQRVSIIKSRQLGLSELGIEQMIYFLDTHSYDRVNGLYTFPTYRQLQDFFKQRIRPEFDSGYYATLVDPKQISMNQMKIRDSTLVMRSSSQGSSMEGLQIDLLSLDEYDRLNPLAESSAIESMSSSKYQMIRRWSTPTVKDWGIHKLFEASDKHRWFIKCSHCGYEQIMDYEKNIQCVNPDGVDVVGQTVAPGSYQYVCSKCGKSLEKDRWYGGHWEVTADNPQNKDAGYSISQLDAVWVSADKLKEQELRATFKSSFYNYTLGLPYQDTENTFDGRYVLENRGDFEKSLVKTDDYTDTFVGIDFGQHFHSIIVLGVTPEGEIHYINSCSVPKSNGLEHIEEDFNKMVNFIRPYNPTLIYADSGYSGNYVEKLQVVFGLSRVYGVKVRSALTNRDFNIHVNQSTNEVTLDKLSQNLMLLSALRRGDIKFYKTVDKEIKTFINHGNNIIIRNDEKTDPNTKQVIEVPVILRKGADH